MKDTEKNAGHAEEKPPFVERRRAFRFSLTLAVELQPDDVPVIRTQTLDISAGGMKTTLKEPVTISPLSFSLQIHGEGSIQGKARLVWQQKMGELPDLYVAGWEFAEFESRGREMLEAFLEKVARYWRTTRES